MKREHGYFIVGMMIGAGLMYCVFMIGLSPDTIDVAHEPMDIYDTWMLSANDDDVAVGDLVTTSAYGMVRIVRHVEAPFVILEMYSDFGNSVRSFNVHNTDIRRITEEYADALTDGKWREAFGLTTDKGKEE